jgi:thiosulfate/3-mercaptopyruvate sulfurtransferase
VEFAASMSELGIHKDDILIVYDTMERDILLAPRVGWMLKAFGHRHVHTLNNFRLWVEQGLPTAQGDICGFDHSNYPVPKIDEAELPSIEDVREATMNYNKDMEPRID